MSTPSLLNIPYRLKAGTLYSQLPETGAGDFTVTRTTTVANQSTRINSLGNIELVADNVPRLDYPVGGAVNGCPALLVEPSAVNLALHSRDLTQAAWVASGITPLRNAVGMDGAANTGTTLTATGANGTILQTLTHASQVRAFSAYVRRTVGTGTIEITTNGGTTWTPITLTSAYTRFSTTATVTNGQVGFRIVTSGDAIVVDYCQGEVGTVATSAIPTTTAAVTRSADVIRKTGITSLIGQSEGTVYFEVEVTAEARDKWFFTLDSASNSFIQGYITTARVLGVTIINAGATVMTNLNSSVLSVGYHKVAFAYNTATNGCEMFIDGVQNPVASRTVTGAGLPAFNNFTFGSYLSTQTDTLKGHVRAGALYPNRLTNAQLATLTAP